MNLRAFPSTAGVDTSALVLLKRAPKRKTLYSRRRADFVRTLSDIEPVALAAAGGSVAVALPRALPESSWTARYGAPPASLDPAGMESFCCGFMELTSFC
jgi:hypothetical protein